MTPAPIHLTSKEARRLLLARAGLLSPKLTGLPGRSRGTGKSAREAALKTIRRFGYLQLDTVSIAGARSQAIVLLSRLEGLKAETAEELLRPGIPLFEYWGHEASWIPMELYPTFAFRRKRFRKHPWWGDIIGNNRKLARDVVKRVREEGPLRSLDLEGKGSSGWWNLKVAKRVAVALWSSGDLVIRERRRFQRAFDLPERVIPKAILAEKNIPQAKAVEKLVLLALEGHGIATSSVLSQTWRFTKMRKEVDAALVRLHKQGLIQSCTYDTLDGKTRKGWIRPTDLELVDQLKRVRVRKDRGVLLSPFDPVLWDRSRVTDLFGFHQVLEIFMPEPKRTYGYFCLPILAGEDLIGRVDLKANRKKGELRVLSTHFESTGSKNPGNPTENQAYQVALRRYGEGVGLRILDPLKARRRKD